MGRLTDSRKDPAGPIRALAAMAMAATAVPSRFIRDPHVNRGIGCTRRNASQGDGAPAACTDEPERHERRLQKPALSFCPSGENTPWVSLDR
jgi:hypothetical protein